MIIYSNGYNKDNRPIIAFQSKALSSNTIATSENSSYPVINLTNPNENQRWESSTSAEQYITVTLDNENIDYVAFAGHNFSDDDFSLSVETFDGSVWTERVEPQMVSDNKPVMMIFDEINCQGVRLKISSSDTTPTISVFYVGKTLKMERNVYVGHKPINYAKKSNVVNGMSESGRFIGRIVVGENYNTDVEIDNITPNFFREKINPFFIDAEENPFFFAWRPLSYPDEVGYAWLRDNGVMTNQRSNGFVNISFPISAIVDGRSITTAQPTERFITISEDTNNLNLRTLYDSLFPTPLDTTILNVIINNDVTIGSTSVNNAALDIGSWPSGTTIKIDLAGTIQGAGGAGGDAPDGEGNDGGDAIVAARAVTIDLANGGSIIDGAGGGAADTTNGGGGGSGSTGGAGGAADGGTAGNSGTSTTGGTASGNAGAGGNSGLAGDDSDTADGGDSGCTIDDNPFITVLNSGSGTIEGCNVNSPNFGSLTIDITTNQTDYNLRTAYDLVHPTPDANTVLDVYVRNGVTINSSDPTIPAFTVGSWPTGATIVLHVNGSILGAGGDGGDAANGAGEDGGDALVTTFPISIDFADQGSGANGLIASGGGGGEAGTSSGGGGGSGNVSGSDGSDASASDLVPTMTSDTNGIVELTYSEQRTDQSGQAYHAFDKNSGTEWASGSTTPKFLNIDFNEEVEIISYTVGNSTTNANDNFASFDLQVSDDGVTYTTVDSQTGVTWSGSETKTFTLSSAQTATHVRITNIVAVGGADKWVKTKAVEFIGTKNDGGAGGSQGQDGYDNTSVQGGSGAGSAGNAIDGVSNVTKLNSGDGTITGPEVN